MSDLGFWADVSLPLAASAATFGRSAEWFISADIEEDDDEFEEFDEDDFDEDFDDDFEEEEDDYVEPEEDDDFSEFDE